MPLWFEPTRVSFVGRKIGHIKVGREQLQGGQLVARALRRRGSGVVFGLRGPQCEPLLAGCEREGIRVVDAHQHSTAGFAADAHARISGLAGVVVVAAGPAITGVATALATAQRAHSPMVCLAASPAKSLDELGAYQSLPALALVQPLVKYAARVNETRRLQEFIERAFRIAHAGLPGPVYLELPLDVLTSLGEDSSDSLPALEPACPAASNTDISRARSMLSESQRPCFVLGTQLRWSRHRERLRQLVERLNAPFFLNGMARGALPAEHPLLLSACRVRALAECDLSVVLGTPFDFRLSYGNPSVLSPRARVIQVDLDPFELGRNRPIDLGIQADVGEFLRQLTEGWSAPDCAAWLARLHEIEADKRAQKSQPGVSGRAATEQTLRRELAARIGPNDTVVSDGGRAVTAVTQGLPIAWPQLLLDAGPFGTQGVGAGFAMAAALLRREGRTVTLLGSRAFGLCAMEFESLVRQGLNTVAVVCTAPNSAHAERLNPHCERVVEALGGRGFWAQKAAEVGPALDEAWAADRASLVCVRLAA